MLGDLGIDKLAAMGFQPREGPFLVGTDQPAVTRDVHGEDGGQLSFDALRGQSGAPEPHARISTLGHILSRRATTATIFRTAH